MYLQTYDKKSDKLKGKNLNQKGKCELVFLDIFLITCLFTDGVKLWLFRNPTESISQDLLSSPWSWGFGFSGDYTLYIIYISYILYLNMDSQVIAHYTSIKKSSTIKIIMSVISVSNICFSTLIAFVPIWSSVYTTQVYSPQTYSSDFLFIYFSLFFFFFFFGGGVPKKAPWVFFDNFLHD